MRIKILLLIGFTFVMLHSCTKDSMFIKPQVLPPVNTTVKFSTDVYPIFTDKSCTACHGTAGGLSLTGTTSAVRTNLLTTGSVVANSSATSSLFTKFANGGSHNGLTFNTTQLGNIKSWIDLGALDN